MKAVIIGATGATGKCLVNLLLNLNSIKNITTLVRTPLPFVHPKLKQIVVNFESLNNYSNYINGDIAFSCLGTTLKDAGSKENQRKIDLDYQLQFAKIAKTNKIPVFTLLSAVNANAQSTIFYNQIKGILENEISNLKFESLLIFQPAGLIRPNSNRFGEKIFVTIVKLFNKINLLNNYKPLSVTKVAKAMAFASMNPQNGLTKFSVKKIDSLSKNKI